MNKSDTPHTNGLRQWLIEAIGQNDTQMITFHDYMQACLYHPQFGYYMCDKVKIGRDGDFYTSSRVGSLMGEVLASSIVKQWGDRNGPIRFIEWGGGDGRLSATLMDTWQAKHPLFYEQFRFYSIETSHYHRKLQQKSWQNHLEKVEWGDDWPSETSMHTVVLANELLDAFPVHRFVWLDGTLHEMCVGYDLQKDQFQAHYHKQSSSHPFTQILQSYPIHPLEGQQFEWNPYALDWLKGAADHMQNGQVIIIDYGDIAEELYAEHRMLGTLICYRKHQAHHDPFLTPGEQDITSHVNFSELMRAGEQLAFREIAYKTQQQFLIDGGIFDLLQEHANLDPFSPEARRNRSIRQLLLSDQMSELFKVLVLNK